MSLLKSLRKPKIGGLAVFDLATALAGMWLIAPRVGVSRERALWATIPLGVVTHKVFGIDTALTRGVFGPGHVVTKLAVAGMLYKAVRA